jgi:ABC-type dipeptide/oligopeptide/nickel transport system permease subunit
MSDQASELIAEAYQPVAGRRVELWRAVFRKRVTAVAAALIVTYALVAFLGPTLLPLDPYRTNLRELAASPSLNHLLGTDLSGRDNLSRIVYGMRTSMIVGVAAVGIYIAIGIAIGTLAGFHRGLFDTIASRFVDALLSIPLLLLVTVFVAVLEPGVLTVILVIGLLGWPQTARLTRAQTLSLRESDFVIAARVTGLSPARVLYAHVLPNLAAPLIVVASLGIGTAILLEAALGFLGLGVRPPTPSLGVMITEAKDPITLRTEPWIWMPPAVALASLVMAVNLLGDALRDALDPGSSSLAAT